FVPWQPPRSPAVASLQRTAGSDRRSPENHDSGTLRCFVSKPIMIYTHSSRRCGRQPDSRRIGTAREDVSSPLPHLISVHKRPLTVNPKTLWICRSEVGTIVCERAVLGSWAINPAGPGYWPRRSRL